MSPYLINITFHRNIRIFVKNLTSLTIFYYTCLNHIQVSINSCGYSIFYYIFKCSISKLIQILSSYKRIDYPNFIKYFKCFQIMLYAHYWIVCTTNAKINHISVEYVWSMKLNSFTQPNSLIIFSLFLSYYMYIWLLGVRFLYQLY